MRYASACHYGEFINLLKGSIVLVDEIKECSKCGICRSACPVFLVANNEVMSPRGRISLVEAMLEGKLSLSDRYVDTIRACIKCTRCADVCPSGVRPEKIVQSAREMFYDTSAIPDEIKELLHLTLDPEQFREFLNHQDTQSDPADKLPLWWLLMFHGRAYLPELAEKSVLESYPEYTSTNGKLKVALFLGCAINYSQTTIVDSVIDVLNKLGVDVFLPKDQTCCGAPLLFYGDREGAKEMAKRNVKALKYDEFDAVITLCPACAVTFKQEYERILGDGVEKFISKVYDVSEFITKFVEVPSQRMDVSVTYHDPCYLRLSQKVFKEPRQILKNTANFIEMKDANKCCGLGGTLELFHPEISMKIGESKVRNIMQSGADIVATGCPGCITFIKHLLKQNNINKEVLHTVQVIQRSFSA